MLQKVNKISSLLIFFLIFSLNISLAEDQVYKFKSKNTNFIDVIGVAILSGVGFTMSLFIGNLAFFNNDVLMNSAKIGILFGSLTSGIVGYIVLRWSILKKNEQINKSNNI